MAVRTSSDAVNGGAGGKLAATADMTRLRLGLVRLALLFVAILRMPQHIARGIWNLPADFRAFRQLQNALRQSTDEDMLDDYFGAVGHESDEPSADKVRPCRIKF